MSRFRCLLAWLIMAALPLQGLAASSMLFCGVQTHHGSAPAPASHVADPGSAAQMRGHDHAAHAASGLTQEASAESQSAHQAPDVAHKCSVCAACSHTVAITELPQVMTFTSLPQARVTEPFLVIHARPSAVAERPPRA